MFLNGFSIGNVWGIFEVAYLPAGGSYWSAFCCITSGIWRASQCYKFFCHEAILLEVIKEIATAISTCPYYRHRDNGGMPPKRWIIKDPADGRGLAGQKECHKLENSFACWCTAHAARVVLLGRSFVSRMCTTAAKVKELGYFTMLNKNFRSDLYWWHTFLLSWNGRSLLKWHSQNIFPDAVIVTDASGSWECGTGNGYSGNGLRSGCP